MTDTVTMLVHEGESLQAAIDMLPEDPTVPAVITLTAGTWHEKIELCRSNTALQGAGADKTLIVWQDAATDPMADVGNRGTFRTATLRTDGDHITLRGMRIQNAAAPRERVGQCIALYADGDDLLCEECCLSSYQDTLFTAPLPPREVLKNGFIGPKQYAPRKPQRHVYRACRIEGDVDFIFGGAAAWFEDCDIVSIDGRECRENRYGGYATAASTPQGQTFGYVFSNCRFVGEDVPEQTVYLGRPWREFAKTVLLSCYLGAHIRPEKWNDWGKATFGETGLYAMHGCTGPGLAGKSAPFARTLTDEEAARITLERFLETPAGA